MFAVITENDESQWEDQTGVAYHFPQRYLPLLQPGTRVVYYKGRLKNARFAKSRLSPQPHYFGTALIGKVYPDKSSDKRDYFALIEEFSPFTEAVLSKTEAGYLEEIPANRQSNYWRDGVRGINQRAYEKITGGKAYTSPLPVTRTDDQRLESYTEGDPSRRYSTIYERNPKLRVQAILVHGVVCKACGFDFQKSYGDYAAGYIHIHHTKPISSYGKSIKVDPELDLIPLCANCHSVVHRRKDRTLSLLELKELLDKQSKPDGI